MQQRVDKWRDTLREILADEQEAKRITRVSKISAITLSRWIDGSSTPRKAYLQKLIETCSQQYRNALFVQLQQAGLLDETDMEAPPLPEEPKELSIPAEFYDQVARTVGATSESLRAWTICQLVLRQCSAQLATLVPSSSTMMSILICNSPLAAEGKPEVRSLRELVYMQPTEKAEDQEFKAELNTRFLLGAESLVGQACSTLQVEIEQPMILESTLGFRRFLSDAQSAAAVSLLRSGHIGGCLLLVSREAEFFTPARIRLINSYASLAALAFRDEAFYAVSQINLAILPLPQEQRIIPTIRQRIISLMRQPGPAARSATDAEILAWNHIEHEQIAVASQP